MEVLSSAFLSVAHVKKSSASDFGARAGLRREILAAFFWESFQSRFPLSLHRLHLLQDG
jgi:hypothetical protein